MPGMALWWSSVVARGQELDRLPVTLNHTLVIQLPPSSAAVQLSHSVSSSFAPVSQWKVTASIRSLRYDLKDEHRHKQSLVSAFWILLEVVIRHDYFFLVLTSFELLSCAYRDAWKIVFQAQ